MISPDAIFETVESHVRLSRDRFVLIGGESSPARPHTEIPPPDFLIPLIENVDRLWAFDTEPTPRMLGRLIELLRGCRILRKRYARGNLIILPDKDRARSLGAFDTPQPIVRYITETVVSPLCKGKKPPLIVDPASGAGYFMLEALDILIRRFPKLNPETILSQSLLGFDLDPVAIALSKRNLKWHLENKHNIRVGNRSLNRCLKLIDALSPFDQLPIKPGQADVVIGNPPYQFFSGRGSPIASLRKSGRLKDAEKLSDKLDELAQRFPRTSKGCRDRYKWFVNRAIEFLQPGGTLGFIIPNTWIAYPRYSDLRILLHDEGNLEALIDLGALAFKRVHVPTAIMIWRKNPVDAGRPFPFTKLTRNHWVTAMDGDVATIPKAVRQGRSFRLSLNGDLQALKKPSPKIDRYSELIDFLLHAPEAPHRTTLGQITTLREGSHAIEAVKSDVPREPDAKSSFPVLIDKTMGNLISPVIGYIKPPVQSPSKLDHYEGRRFLIRKTGDRIVVAPSPTEKFALAHQNVYVGKLTSPIISFHALLGILSSKLITDLYRAGIGGQHHRPLAQLRILFLNRLPIIILPDVSASSRDVTRQNRLEPIPRVFPSEKKKQDIILRKIAHYHAMIAELTIEQIANPSAKTRHEIDEIVYHLYGGRTDND